MKKSIKRVSILALAICLITTVFTFNSNTLKAKAATTKVQMYYLNYIPRYHSAGTHEVYVIVDSNGANKKVTLHYEDVAGAEWKDLNGEFVKNLNNGTEIWKVKLDGVDCLQYAIRYDVDGQTYWDNNNTKNYTLNNELGVANLKLNTPLQYGLNAEYYPISVTVKNLAYNKVVKVRYTQDNWATYTDENLSYSYGNSDGTETWSTTLKLDSNKKDQIHYAISYTVNGVTYWDNFFGNNYNFYSVY